MSEILGDKLNIVYEDTLLEITPELLKKTILKQNKEIERLNNTIKEVRKYIEEHNLFSFSENDHDWYDYITDNNTKNELLKILDKVGDEK